MKSNEITCRIKRMKKYTWKMNYYNRAYVCQRGMKWYAQFMPKILIMEIKLLNSLRKI